MLLELFADRLSDDGDLEAGEPLMEALAADEAVDVEDMRLLARRASGMESGDVAMIPFLGSSSSEVDERACGRRVTLLPARV